MKFVLVDNPEKRKVFDTLVITYHSYVPTAKALGRRVDFLVYDGEKVVGAIGLASSPILLRKCLLEYFRQFTSSVREGTKVDVTPIYNQIANNWRFTLAPEAPQNSGSKCLALLALLGAREWKRKYGDPLHWIISFVGAGKSGTIYKGAGWKLMGTTSGRAQAKGAPFKGIGNNDKRATKEAVADIKLIFLKEIGEATVVQCRTPDVQSGNGGHSDPVAPATKSYKLVVKGGRARIVKM